MVSEQYWKDDETEDRAYHKHQQRHRFIRSPARKHIRWRLRHVILSVGLLFGVYFWWTSHSHRTSTLDWSKFAYSQYATDTQSLCNALMVFESLDRLNSQASRVLLYPKEWDDDDRASLDWKFIRFAQSQYKVKIQPVHLISADGRSRNAGTLNRPTSSDWNLSLTKLRIFELTQYERILHLDSDVTLLRHLDELFSLPKTPIAMPRAYWSDGPSANWPLTSMIMLIEPNPQELTTMINTLHHWQLDAKYSSSMKYDMDLLNHRFGASAMVLPHRPYAMLTAEFRKHDHRTYLGYLNNGDNSGNWNPDAALKEAKLVHFSDWPLPKPWILWPEAGLKEIQPDCGGKTETCREREIWKDLYKDFRERRKDICRILPVPAPDWRPRGNKTTQANPVANMKNLQ